MNNSKPRFRILNKTNKTVTIKIGPETHTLSWDEYNKTFVTEDKFWAVFNEENQKNHELAESKIADATAAFLMARAFEGKDTSKYMTYMLMFGTYLEEIQKILNCSLMEASQIIRRRLMAMNPFMVNPMFPVSNSQKKLRRKMEREADSEMNITTTPVKENKPTLGDAFACLGELKEKMDKDNG